MTTNNPENFCPDCEALEENLSNAMILYDYAKLKLTEAEERLEKINELIYATGAPLGSNVYFEIRKLATK